MTPGNRIPGCLRLSLSRAAYVPELGNAMGWGRVEGGVEAMRAEHAAGVACETLEKCEDGLPRGEGEAVMRGVHVCGMSTQLGADGTFAQHLGLRRRLVERAGAITCEAGYGHVNVSSAVSMRDYYRRLGFCDHRPCLRQEQL